MKDAYITLRITSEEKAQMESDAKAAGFDSVSAYLLWLYRKQRINGS